MSGYYIAVDGGGSKTAFCVLNADTGDTYMSCAGTSNYKIAEPDLERVNILEGLQGLFREHDILASQVRGMVMGMSGFDSPEDYQHYLSIALETGVAQERIYLCNDSELAFYAGGTPPGLCIIAGTGSVSTGIARDGSKARSGGWGVPVSDEGSGVWIGAQAMQAALRHVDGYGFYQPLFDELRKSLGVARLEELPKALSQINLTGIAEQAKVVMALADDQKDPYALSLVEQAGELVAEIAASVYGKLDFRKEEKVDVVMAGSLFKSQTFQEAYEVAFQRIIAMENIRFLKEIKNPVLGGIVLARKMFAQGTSKR